MQKTSCNPADARKPPQHVIAGGQIVATPGALAALAASNLGTAAPAMLLTRHFVGDWGDLCDDDKLANDEALAEGVGRIFSAYDVPSGASSVRVWIITEHDRSATTILLPDEY
jgi:hypothetical protein